MTLYLDPTDEAEVPDMFVIISVGQNVVLQDGQTLELRLDVADTTGPTSEVRGGGLGLIESVSPEMGHSYYATVEPVIAIVGKNPGNDSDLWPRYGGGSYFSPGLTLILSVTRMDSTRAMLRLQVVDRNQNNRVVYSASCSRCPRPRPSGSSAAIRGCRAKGQSRQLTMPPGRTSPPGGDTIRPRWVELGGRTPCRA